MKHSSSNLDQIFLKGLAWTVGAKWSTQLITWAGVVAIARLLSPAELGLAGMAGVFILMTNMLAEFGIGGAVLQLRYLDEDEIAQLHSASAILAGIMSLFTIVSSPYVAQFFGNDTVQWLVIGASPIILATGFQTIPNGILRRNMDYRRMAILEAVQFLSRTLVTVVAALLGASYWSILIGTLVSYAINVVMLAIWVPFRFQVPQWKKVKVPLRFGGQLAMSSIQGSLGEQSDSIVIGNRLGEGPMGAYRLAFDLARAPSDRITSLIMRVATPLFASISNDLPLTRRYYLRLTEVLSMTIFPVVVGVSILSPEIVAIFFGDKWIAAVGAVAILTLATAPQALSALNGQVLLALHRPGYLLKVSTARLLLMPVAFIFLAPFGITAVASAWLWATPAFFLATAIPLFRGIDLPVRTFIRSVWPAVFATAVMFGALYVLCLAPSLEAASHLVRVLAISAAGAAVYFGIFALFFRERLTEYWHFLRRLKNKRPPEIPADEVMVPALNGSADKVS